MGQIADLARLLTHMPRAQAFEAAASAGFRHVERLAEPAPSQTAGGSGDSVGGTGERINSPLPPGDAEPDADVPFWCVTNHERVQTDAQGESAEGRAAFETRDPGDLRALPPLDPFCPWVDLWPRLYALIADRIAGQAVDTARLTRQISECCAITRIPRQTVTRWPARLLLWADADKASIPLWLDRDRVAARLAPLCEQVRLGSVRDWRAGETILRLGALPSGHRRLGEQVASNGKRATALTFDDAPRRGWQTAPWAAVVASVGTAETRAHRLRVMLSPIAWVHLGLLREIRQLLPPAQADIRTELDVWNGAGVRSAALDGLVFEPEFAVRWQAEFKTLPVDLQAAIHARIAAYHARAPEELRHVEALVWQQLGARTPQLFDPQRARDFIQGASNRVLRGGAPELRSYARAASEQLVDVAGRDPVLRPAVSRLWYAGHQGIAVEVPAQIDSAQAGAVLNPSDRQSGVLSMSVHGVGLGPGVALRTVDWAPGGWRVAIDGGPERQVPALQMIALAGRKTVRIDTGFERLELEAIPQPDWATSIGRDREGAFADALIAGERYRFRWHIGTGWIGPDDLGLGVDEFGVFEDLSIANITFRFRLIPAGTFMMGSADDEDGRDDDEGPQHEVSLTEPFWLAETPVTQALWQAVTGENPSGFKGADRPVEKVSWDDVMQFIDKVELSQPGLALRLPTEAQWEYACRAGTTTPRFGELDAVAWYYDNSGGETHPVKQKQVNAWGLYDMLGNVYEWCADWKGSYQPGAVTNSTGAEEGSNRVNRGGSWNNSAVDVRAAYRSGGHPGYRYRNRGFRLSRGPAPSARSAERAEPASKHRSDPPARSDGAEGQARSAGGGASLEGSRPKEAAQTKRPISSRRAKRKKDQP